MLGKSWAFTCPDDEETVFVGNGIVAVARIGATVASAMESKYFIFIASSNVPAQVRELASVACLRLFDAPLPNTFAMPPRYLAIAVDEQCP